MINNFIINFPLPFPFNHITNSKSYFTLNTCDFCNHTTPIDNPIDIWDTTLGARLSTWTANSIFLVSSDTKSSFGWRNSQWIFFLLPPFFSQSHKFKKAEQLSWSWMELSYFQLFTLYFKLFCISHRHVWIQRWKEKSFFLLKTAREQLAKQHNKFFFPSPARCEGTAKRRIGGAFLCLGLFVFCMFEVGEREAAKRKW